ncbi:MAG: hypothetical protein IJP69_01890 [Synergistaceae bacterium]|nr:hypothetical protein [Synergistaceae bacterium]MBR0079105.1 hypothetical protein [Synergistaceae bacterium]MBR0234826.1 hypothetical protein [Synergistaceae bacterium]MBR0253993.1 hypothetical protein [Synergistaceae bacterium]
MEQNFLYVTKKELFYTAVMLQLKQLVNIVYDFPADETKFEQELNEARSSLRKKKLLVESARNGITLDTALCTCAAFCAEPEKCEVVDENNYYATIYMAEKVHMLLERRSEDEFAATWYLDKENLDKYIDSKIKQEVKDDGEA